MARASASALRAEAARLLEQADIAETMETGQGALGQAQAELAGLQQQVAIAKTALLAEETGLKEKHQAIAAAQAILAEVNAEVESKKRESLAFNRVAETQITDARAALHRLVPVEPAGTPEEVEND